MSSSFGFVCGLCLFETMKIWLQFYITWLMAIKSGNQICGTLKNNIKIINTTNWKWKKWK